MKILAIADTEERCLWECFRKERFEGVDLILSAGDLDPDYLEFLVTVINRPLIYVRGNHDDATRVMHQAAVSVSKDSVYVYRGVRIAALAGPCVIATAPTCTPNTRWPGVCASCPAK